MPQEQVQKVHHRPTADSAERTADDDLIDRAVADAAGRVAADTADVTGDLLDEIDQILTEEEEFAVNYRQRGGQAVQVVLDWLARGLLSFPTLPVWKHVA